MPNNIQPDGIPAVITQDMLREVIAAMDACYTLIEKGQAICTEYLDSESGLSTAVKAMSKIMVAIDGPEPRGIMGEAQRLYEKYDESRAVSGIGGAPSDDDLDIALKGLAEVIKRALFIRDDPEKTIGELWIEYGKTISPEMAERIEATLDTYEITMRKKDDQEPEITVRLKD